MIYADIYHENFDICISKTSWYKHNSIFITLKWLDVKVMSQNDGLLERGIFFSTRFNIVIEWSTEDVQQK